MISEPNERRSAPAWSPLGKRFIESSRSLRASCSRLRGAAFVTKSSIRCRAMCVTSATARLKSFFVRPCDGLVVPLDLADELQRRRAHLVVGRGWPQSWRAS